MKKVMLLLILSLLLINMVAAVQGNAAMQASNAGSGRSSAVQEKIQNQVGNSGIGQELQEQIRERNQEIRQGNYITNQGQLLQVREMVQGLKELRTNNIAATTQLNLTEEKDEQNRTRLRARLINGSESEIKIMPDTAKERALERLRLKGCNEENNCTISLKDVGQRNQSRLAYEIQVERHYKLLGLFKAKAQNRIQIEAENGETIQIKQPWWSFLATKED